MTQKSWNFVNRLLNTDVVGPDDPNPDGKGLSVKGAIYWEDAGDRLGYRPESVEITLWQTGRDGSPAEYGMPREVMSADGNTYEFTRLPKYWYDGSGTPWRYEYTVSERFEAVYALQDGTITNAYTILKDMPKQEGYINFTNRFNVPEGPINHMKRYSNTINLYTNMAEHCNVVLKQLEQTIDADLNSHYGDYSGKEIRAAVNNDGVTLKDIPCGKYEIQAGNRVYVLKDISLTEQNHVSVTQEDGRYYMVIEDSPEDAYGNLLLCFDKDGDAYYKDSHSKGNFFSVSMEQAALFADFFMEAVSGQTITAE